RQGSAAQAERRRIQAHDRIPDQAACGQQRGRAGRRRQEATRRIQRCRYRGDANDTRAIIQRLAKLRAERAELLGFKNFASYSLDDQMAKTPDNAIKLMTDMVPAATAKAAGEQADMQALVDKQKGGFKIAPWDWQFYAEQVRKAQYDLDESQIKPYFELDNVLQNGVFFAANKLYG